MKRLYHSTLAMEIKRARQAFACRTLEEKERQYQYARTCKEYTPDKKMSAQVTPACAPVGNIAKRKGKMKKKLGLLSAYTQNIW